MLFGQQFHASEGFLQYRERMLGYMVDVGYIRLGGKVGQFRAGYQVQEFKNEVQNHANLPSPDVLHDSGNSGTILSCD